MPRYWLLVQYDGSGFSGWQSQPGGIGVQDALEDAVERLTGERARIHGAGRTDAGVHAWGQVAHVDLPRLWQPERLALGLGFHMRSRSVAVLGAGKAAPHFDARRSAVMRTYCYGISPQSVSHPLGYKRMWSLSESLDIGAMDKAAKVFVGRHDFSQFRAAGCWSRSPIGTLCAVTVDATTPFAHHGHNSAPVIRITVRAPVFFYRQMRFIVGALVAAGARRKPLELGMIARSLRTGEPLPKRFPVAPPWGLYLAGVDYPQAFGPIAPLPLSADAAPDGEWRTFLS